MDEYINRVKIDREFIEAALEDNEGCREAWLKAMSILRKMPKDDVETVVHAEWLHEEEDKYKCSHCGSITKVDEVMDEPIYSGCPYCRAKMDLEE